MFGCLNAQCFGGFVYSARIFTAAVTKLIVVRYLISPIALATSPHSISHGNIINCSVANVISGMGNIMESMKKAQEIAKQAESANKELSEARVTGKDPSGQVEALFNGLGVPIEMKVSDSICSQGGDAVSVACTQAVNDAYLKSRNVMMARMQQVYSGMELK